ncbi:YopX family protein [Desulfosporosinus sp. PR]|uniref:YopX family protein n=1 Tax=Candidatus Desulfosporosinus nitrosoreducens TaxID=3401928 RepID=UPI0027F0F99D|nr:YopX family protein [Desulfosporosinus sp. PR]MDQ7094190.1 YopX family protein [Desulfosporosinus sp. PR]
MNRPIKFRAWDKANKCMKVVSELDFLYEKSQKITWGMQGITTDVWLNGEDESYIPSDVVLLQFTGLKDKNGKEIYEGDIIRYQRRGQWGEYEERETTITWKEDKASFNPFYYFNPYDYETDKVEVIGNIYENNSLLEVQP